MKKTLKSTLAFFLAFVMIFGAAPLSGFVGLDFRIPKWLNFDWLKFNTNAVTSSYNFIEAVNRKIVIPDGYIGIYNAPQLNDIRQNLSGKYILMNDIDLSSWGEWSPIGYNSTGLNEATAFRGVFDGNGYVIKNINVDIVRERAHALAGLFGQTYMATISNLGVMSGRISAKASVYYARSYAGGIIGEAYDSEIINCFNSATIYAQAEASSNIGTESKAGGIIGQSINSLIRSCFNLGTIETFGGEGSSTCDCGGIIGLSMDSEVSTCYNNGTINSYGAKYGSDLGGIIGVFITEDDVNHNIKDCYNTGNINGKAIEYIAGYEGLGGIIGAVRNSGFLSIFNCYNTGTITSQPTNQSNYIFIGGLLGHNEYRFEANYCYYLNNLESAVGYGANILLKNVSALTTSQIKIQSSFNGFDFESIWKISSTMNNGSPYLSPRCVIYNFEYHGGSDSTKTSEIVKKGAVIDLTPTAYKSGWTFVGWNTNSAATTALTSLNMGTSDVTLYAIFSKTLTGTFIDYSGTTKTTRTASKTIYNNAISGSITTPAQNTYTGWTSRGWGTGTGASASVVTAGNSSYTLSSNTTFYGLYQKTLTLSYNANGGSTTPPNQTGTRYVNSYSNTTYANPTFTLAAAISKTGSTFSKWRIDGTDYNAGASVSLNANATATAQWNAVTHSVTYNYSENGGTPTTPLVVDVAEGAAIDLSKTGTKTGWTFVGWNTNKNATVKLNSLNMGTGNITLYAVYSKVLTGSFKDTTGTQTATTIVYNKSTSGIVTAPSQRSYSGWTSRGWGTGTAADAAAVSNFSITTTEGTKNYYGLYQRTLTLSYNANGGSPTPSSQTGTQYANSYSISTTKNPSFTLAAAISRSGYTFNKWAAGSVSGTQYSAGANIVINTNTTMYALWITNSVPSLLNPSDIYYFANSSSSFGCPTYTMSDSDFLKLTNYVKKQDSNPQTTINYLQDMRESSWGGSCYGMATTTILDKIGKIRFNENFDPGAVTMFQVDKPYQNSIVRSAINYYQISQCIKFTRTGSFYSKSNVYWSQGLRKLVETASSGNLMLFCYWFSRGGHAIVIVGYNATASGDHNLIAYDNRYPNNYINVVVSKDYKTCVVNGSEQATAVEFLTDFSSLDKIDIDGPNNDMIINSTIDTYQNNNAEIRIPSDSIFTIENKEGKILTYNNGTVTGTMEVISSRMIVNSTVDGEPAPATIVFEVPNSASFVLDSEADIYSFSLLSPNVYTSVDASGVSSVVVAEDEGLYIIGDVIEYKASLSVNNEIMDMISIQGKADNDVSLEFHDDGIIADGVESDNNTLTVYSGITKTENIDFDTACDTVLITGAASGNVGDVDIRVSSKDDGIYDTSLIGKDPVLRLSQSTMELQFKASSKLEEVNGISVTWSSSNPKIVSVDQEGNIKGLRQGTATITATTEDGETAACEVTVKLAWWQWILKIVLFGWIWYY